MLKKVMLLIMVLGTALRFFGLTLIFSTDIERLPMVIYISTGAVVVLGIYLICKNIIKTVTQKELVLYYSATITSVIVNLIGMKLLSRVELNMIDLIAIGNIMDIIMGVTLIAMAMKERRYIQFRIKP